tara:strand:+ start:164 stop:508 length:345 start_codon:yes stop_codon:yes gene_type:complete
MPRLNHFKIKIETGAKGLEEPVHFAFNGFKLPFEAMTGGTGPGETFESSYEVNSFPHSMTLIGPNSGEWDISKMVLNFDVEGSEPYSITFGQVTLNEFNEANIWQDPPLPAFDV